MCPKNITSHRILFVTETFFPVIGGAEISAFTTLLELAYRGLRISVLTHRHLGTNCQEDCYDIEINRERFLSRNRLLFYLKAALITSKYIMRRRPQVILSQQIVSIPVVALSKIFHIPSIVMIHDYWPLCNNRMLLTPNRKICSTHDSKLKSVYNCVKNDANFKGPKIVKNLLAMPKSILVLLHSLIIKCLLRSADALIANSRFLKKVLVMNGFEARKIEVIYPPIKAVGPSTDSGDEASIKNFATILFVGRLSSEKGADFLLRAVKLVLRRLYRVKLIIVGKGNQEGFLRFLAKSLQIEDYVEFRGLVSHETLDSLYRSSSVVAVPSIWPEPFGRVVVEAIMHGTPVVASNVGGIPELITSERGILVPPRDINALANALVFLMACNKSFKPDQTWLKRFLPANIATLLFNVIEKKIRD